MLQTCIINMKTIKSVILSAFAFCAVAISTLTISSCEQDSCTTLNCINGGQCTEGVCQCPDGYEGAECETAVADKYVGVYEGTVRCNYNDLMFPITPDTVRIDLVQRPSIVKLEVKGGNTSLQNFNGKVVDGKNIQFEPLISRDSSGNEVARIEAYVDFDGDLIKVFFQTTNKLTQEKQACSFIGKRHIYVED